MPPMTASARVSLATSFFVSTARFMTGVRSAAFGTMVLAWYKTAYWSIRSRAVGWAKSPASSVRPYRPRPAILPTLRRLHGVAGRIAAGQQRGQDEDDRALGQNRLLDRFADDEAHAGFLRGGVMRDRDRIEGRTHDPADHHLADIDLAHGAAFRDDNDRRDLVRDDERGERVRDDAEAARLHHDAAADAAHPRAR